MLSKKHIRNILLFFVTIFSLITFSFVNIFTLIITCNKYYCYYKKCVKYNILDKINCFFDKTDDIGDWIMLNLFSLVIIFSIIVIFVVGKIFYKKIKNFYIKYKNKKRINEEKTQVFFSESTNIEIREIEEIYSEERDPLINV
jgi:hypothetical protein